MEHLHTTICALATPPGEGGIATVRVSGPDAYGIVGKIFAPEPIVFSWVSVGVLAASIVVKCWMAAFNANMGRRIGSTTLEATASDSRNDVITTSAVLLCTMIARLTGLDLDGYVGAAVAVFILVSGVSLIKETLNPLLGNAPSPELVARIREKLMSYPACMI